MSTQILEQPVPLMLKRVLKDKTDGELIVKSDKFLKTLFFQNGNLIFANTNVIEERLGEILFKIGKINQSQFNDILKLISNKAEKNKLGKILVQKEILSQRDLFFALLYQIRTVAISTFSLASGEWEFSSMTPRVPEDSRFNIELPGIITEGTNKIGNSSYFKNKFLYLAPKTIPIPGKIREFLSPPEINFYKQLSDFINIPCNQVISKLEMENEVFWKRIILFYLLNIVEFSDVSIGKDLDKNVEEIIVLFEQLKEGKIDYYALLGLEKDATFNEVKEVYFKYAKKYHPDRVSIAPDPEIKEKANFVFAEINKAYDILSSEDKRREYNLRGYKEEGMEDTVRENLVEKARILYRKAKTLYSQKKYLQASSLMDEAVELDKYKPSYFLLLGLCQKNLPSSRRMAEKNLQKVIDIEPWNVEAFTAMGILFLLENQLNRAEGFFRKALSINPDHTLARKKLKELKGKKGDKTRPAFSLFRKSKK